MLGEIHLGHFVVAEGKKGFRCEFENFTASSKAGKTNRQKNWYANH